MTRSAPASTLSACFPTGHMAASYRTESTPEPTPEVTVLLRAWGQGDEAAGERLFPILYAELRRQAGRHMRRERRCHTLPPSGLVNEAYLRLAGSPDLDWRSRAQFFAIASRVMRQVLVDHARRRRAAEREGCLVTLTDAGAPAAPLELLDLESALNELALLDARQARVVELRSSAGSTSRRPRK